METSAYLDFRIRTLDRINTCVEKFAYFCELQPGGRKAPYLHWGLSRKYGEKNAQEAIAKAHRENFEQWLNQSLSKMLIDFENFREMHSLSIEDAFEKFSKTSLFLPRDSDDLEAAHLRNSLRVLREMVIWARRPAA